MGKMLKKFVRLVVLSSLKNLLNRLLEKNLSENEYKIHVGFLEAVLATLHYNIAVGKKLYMLLFYWIRCLSTPKFFLGLQHSLQSGQSQFVRVYELSC